MWDNGPVLRSLCASCVEGEDPEKSPSWGRLIVVRTRSDREASAATRRRSGARYPPRKMAAHRVGRRRRARKGREGKRVKMVVAVGGARSLQTSCSKPALGPWAPVLPNCVCYSNPRRSKYH